MTILLSGATGLLGRALLPRLAGRHRLRLLMRPGAFPSARARCDHLFPGHAGLEVIDGDLAAPGLGLSRADRMAAISGVTAVVHLGARTDFRDEDIQSYRPANVAGTRRLAAFAAARGCPFHYVSTAYVAGRRVGTFREDEPGQDHNNAYEQSKSEAEHLVSRWAVAAGFPLAIYRPGAVVSESPRDGIPCGPGPLVHLKLLARLEGRAGDRKRVVRYQGDPRGQLNLVPLSYVTDVLARGIAEAAVGTFHLTAGRSLSISEIAQAMNASLHGVSVDVVDRLDSPDRFEELLERRCRVYRPYTRLHTVFDRQRLVSRFGGTAGDGVGPDWLRQVFARHLRAWRRETAPTAPAADPRVARYFESFLRARQGQNLVPGIRSLRADFTISVPPGRWRLRIEDGRLSCVTPVREPGPFDYEIDAAGFLDLAAGRVRPAELFFEQRVAVRGDVFHAMATATALEEFFLLCPYVAGCES